MKTNTQLDVNATERFKVRRQKNFLRRLASFSVSSFFRRKTEWL